MKCALVTGGSGDIGKAICLKLAASGFHVLVHYRSNSKRRSNSCHIKSTGGSAEICAFDVSDKEQIRSFYQEWKEKNPDTLLAYSSTMQGTMPIA